MKKIFRLTALITAMAVCTDATAQVIPVWKLSDLKTAMDTATQPTVFNFWATFCKPCIAELPQFEKMAAKYKSGGVNLFLVSLDVKEAFPKKVTAFVKKRKLTVPVYYLDEADASLFVPAVDPGWSGSIPASLFVNRATGYRKFVEDELSQQRLKKEVERMLDRKQK